MILESYGFREVGEWEEDKRLKSGVKAKLDGRLDNDRVIYAFVVDDGVKYVGNSPNTTLKKRMGSQRYNKIMPKLILEALHQKKSCKIFALAPEEHTYKGLTIDLVRALEYPLIKQLNVPEWNRRLKRGSS